MKASPLKLSCHAPRFMLAGTGSGAGKTTITLGLMAAFKRKGLVVQGFKAGPDFIDPGFHTQVTGRPSRNLDSWMTGPSAMTEIFGRGSREADLSIVEGMMGLYDGKDPADLAGSSAEIALLLRMPVILVVKADNMAASAAAVVLGFQRMEPDVPIAGVIVNAVGGEGHFRLLKTAIEDRCRIPVVGYLPQEDEIALSERHLGLIPAWEIRDTRHKIDRLAGMLAETVDLDMLQRLAGQAPELQYEERLFASAAQSAGKARIAVAKDAAFHFYYPENLELLAHYGAELLEFAPCDGENVPEQADGLYLGGGFPEEFAAQISRHTDMLADLKERIEEGLPAFAECGGYLLLSESLTDAQGSTHRMAGVIPARGRMQPRLAALGYREAAAHADNPLLAAGETARGHEFHYSTMEYERPVDPAYEMQVYGVRKQEGFVRHHLLAGYTHLHFASNPQMARRFVEHCLQYRKKMRSSAWRKV